MLIFLISTVVIDLILMVKNMLTYLYLDMLLHAIHDYNLHMINDNKFDNMLSYNILPSYYTVLFRLHDWGYKHILPEDVFEKIKPYIKK